MTDRANALPTKQFFIDNVTRDISLEDAILDLVDNAVDSLIRTYQVDVSPDILTDEGFDEPPEFPEPPLIEVTISDDVFEIRDKCGGIDYDHALKNVFRFGRPEEHMESSLGVYGIGLKRAIFKIGNHVTIESRTSDSGFQMDFYVDKWADSDKWSFPLKSIEPAESVVDSGTRITISDLSDEVILRLSDGGFYKRLGDQIARTHSLFLDRFLSVELNGEDITAASLPIGASGKLIPGHETFSWDDVDLELLAGLAARLDGEWKSETAGWYVVCNGRIVVFADKTELTGWGNVGPAFQPKHRGFIGIAFFFSEDPAALPWTTTKRGLNVESRVYQLARKEMASMARPVLSFLNDMYPSVDVEDVPERDLANELEAVAVGDLASGPKKPFERPETSETKQQRSTVYIQYQAEISDVEKIKKHLDQPDWSAKRVGEYTFDYFIRMEIPR